MIVMMGNLLYDSKDLELKLNFMLIDFKMLRFECNLRLFAEVPRLYNYSLLTSA